MTFCIVDSDLTLLATVAEYRAVSVRHLTLLLGKTANGLRRRLLQLRKHELIRTSPRTLGQIRGRPEHVVSLQRHGVELLRSRGLVDSSVSTEALLPTKLDSVEHELLIADFRTQLTQMVRLVPNLTARYFSRALVRSAATADTRLVTDQAPAPKDHLGDLEFIPDGAFALRHAERAHTLLFFLEADRGTEPRRSQRNPKRAFEQKITNYQACFVTGRYKRYEHTPECKLQGFRLLVLTSDARRLASLCALVRASQPCNFIWLTERDKLMTEGVWAPIWRRGGSTTEPLYSILGSALPNPCPRPITTG